MSGLLPPLSSRTSTMSHPTCCCSVSLDRCDRCDLLVGLEGFHLMGVARTPDALVLDVESCNQLVGCPGCGVIAQGHGRMVVEVIDAPWAGVPARIRWHKRRWICRETTCQIATFIGSSHCGVWGGVRSVPGIVGSVVGRRPNTGVRLGRLINQNSHVIWVP